MIAPFDQPARDRFASALDGNFSVVAAAGSGKTTALTNRIVALANRSDALALLPRLVVVTYTNRAANEMQQRTRAEILKARLDVDVLSAFNRAFFGTIHAFCVKLLEAHGHFIGLPSRLELITDDEDLWNDFVQRQEVIGRGLSDEARAILLRYIDARRLLPLGRRGGISADAKFNHEPCPDVNVDALLRFQPSGNSVDTITRTQENLRAWDRARKQKIEFFPLPLRGSKARDFVTLWEEAFGPFREWLSRAALCVAAELERAYRAYRLTSGTLTYADQVALALQLFENPAAARRIRSQQYRVILDEAQDTGPAQFGVLLEATRPPHAVGLWPNEENDPPQPGHFSMVGDFQQSIYSQQADLTHYQRVHDALVAAPGGETVEFSVSFRLDQRAIDFLNETLSQILIDEGANAPLRQVPYLTMQARPAALPGQLVRLEFASHNFEPRTPIRRKAAWEARELARWIRWTGLKKLRAESWRDVAVLCPRKLWFAPLRDALLAEGLDVEVQSETTIKGENPAYAWLTALLTVMADPGETYETVGVLREVFGLSDHDLALFADREGSRFDFRAAPKGDDVVSKKLQLLNELRRTIAHRPLFSAVQQVIEGVTLRARLRALPAADFDGLEDELDTLLASAARAEAERMTLHDFARYLRDDFLTVRDARATSRDSAIQLITSHKAKGSEWQAVIVPFLMREVDTRADNFPRLTTDRASKLQRILFDVEEVTDEMETEAKLIHAQEMERLLYVALTRAKHTLVLASAPNLYATSKAPHPSKSQIKWLRCDANGCNEQAYSSLASEAEADATTASAQREKSSAQRQTRKVADLPLARAKAKPEMSKFVERVSPSGLAEGLATEETNARALQRPVPVRAGTFDNEATRYGHWWHELLQQIDWSANATQWDRTFEAALVTVSNRADAEREWKLLRGHLSGADDFRKRLGSGRIIAQAEFPFLLKIGESAAIEGVIDLVLFAPESRRALILDWKTNRTDSKRVAGLRGKYRSQIAAYWNAVREMTELDVEAALYSVATGKLLVYEPPELVEEWARLSELQPSDLDRAVAPEFN
ncbi:MAG: UvrD-helicase domain-containing protein [Verrucomicrobiota bacterium]|nr:UvrD-helicase domain-containing protein [Verrucomicrobiota bacterium]